MPTADREGQEGWIFSEPLDEDLPVLPGAATFGHTDAGITWRPEIAWPAKQQKLGQLERIFGRASNAVAIAWTSARFPHAGKGRYTLKGSHEGPIAIYIDDAEVFRANGRGKINANISANFGQRNIMVKSESPFAKSSITNLKSQISNSKSWGFIFSLHDANAKAADDALCFTSCCAIQGASDPWLYLGPFDKNNAPPVEAVRDLNKIHTGAGGTGGGGEIYWRLDMPDTWLRPYNENALFGRWNYPLGVTLYGLLHSAKALASTETERYIVDHMLSCCSTFRYALWDKQQYGGATAMHTLLSSIDSLDDCGSFGSVMLEVAKYFPIEGFREIADYVADYISNKQARLPDGTFYRKILMHIFHENTMWADDLYMSVPFLCRYSQLTGDRKYLDDAAKQFLGFKQRLFIPEAKIMSHIFDFRRDMATGVPWGRGNGWTIFSLSELLGVLPDDHTLRPQLLAFFRELCEGYLALQNANGMWHQVLTHHDSYPETSCTSMFIYAFSRGIQFGWLDQPQAYINSVLKAWDALSKISIDRGGNIYGVCRGSEFSFTPEYYKKELTWNLNDTHGIGIVLLAGVEVLRLIDHLQSEHTKLSPIHPAPPKQWSINAQRGLPTPRDCNDTHEPAAKLPRSKRSKVVRPSA